MKPQLRFLSFVLEYRVFLQKREYERELMQEQEGIPQAQQQVVNHSINSDPREQYSGQETYDYERPYDEGYNGLHMDDIRARAREKLQPRQSGIWQGLAKLIALLILVAVFIFVVFLLGLLTSWFLWMMLTVGAIIAAFFIITNWRVVSLPMPVETFQVSASSQLVINNAVGAITLRRGEAGIVSVAATRKASGVGATEQKVQGQYQKMQVQYQQQDRMLRVSTQISWNLFELMFRSIDLEITVPDHCDIVVRDGSGHLVVQGVRGNMQLQTGSGRMTINDVRGQIEAKTGSGRIAVSDVYGQIEIKTGSGRMEASQVDGCLQLRTGSGQIIVQHSLLSAGSILKTGSGSISFDGSLVERGDYQFLTGSGFIGVRLPWNASFRLQAKTGSGPIVNEFASTQVDPDPGTQLKLKTGSGGIVVSRSAVMM
jgi:hypothetical protein